MKKFFVMIIFMFLLTGCGEITETQDENMFVTIQEYDYDRPYDIVYHRNTKVMYVVSHGTYSRGIFTVIVNPDGTPMLYEAESMDEGSDSE